MHRIFSMILLFAAHAWAAGRSEIRNGRFYVDGEPFYVRGIGYAPWRPHQRPGVSYVDTNRRWTEMDFQRIKAAHFNVVRTWEPLDPEELALAQKHGLMVLQGLRLDPRQNFSDPHNLESAIAQARTVAEQSKDFDNVLGYLVMAQLWPEAVVDSGEAETLEFFRRLKRAIQTVDPRPVSMGSWLPISFLDHRDMDFVSFSAFAFWPKSLQHALGQAGVVRWLADRVAAERPLLISDTGGYAVSKATASFYGGAGGYSEYDQSIKNLESLRATVQGHAAGAVLVSWIDTWYHPKDPDTHDDEPWEWNGVLAIPTDSKKDMAGQPRRQYEDVARYNEVILLEPKADHLYGLASAIPIQAYGAENVAQIRFSLNGSDWKPLEGGPARWSLGGGGWHGFFQLPKLARRRQRLAVQALDDHGAVLAVKEISFVAAVGPEQVTISPTAGRKSAVQFTVAASDAAGRPIPDRKVSFGCFYPITLREAEGSLRTDKDGRAALTCPLAPEPKDRYLFVAAGTDSPDRIRTGELRIFKISP